MADNITVQGENTPEYVAYRLMDKIFFTEGKVSKDLTRDEIISTYVLCRRVVIDGAPN